MSEPIDSNMLERTALQMEVERLQNQVATYEVLIGNNLIGAIGKCLDDAGAPRWSPDRKIYLSMFDRIRALAAQSAADRL